jgi:hypothetical protein
MAINWNFNANDYEENTGFKPIPVGEHRVRIASAAEGVSQPGNQKIELVLDVSGYNSRIWHNIVFLTDKPELTNQKLGEFFNSFGIQPGNLNTMSWIGKVGAAKVKHDTYNGETNAKVAYFIAKDRQDKLPAWQEPSNKAEVTGQVSNGLPNGFTPVPDGNVPWN